VPVAPEKLPLLVAELKQAAQTITVNQSIQPLTAVAWSSFITGTNPGKHGIFDFNRRVPGQYAAELTNGGARHGRSLWRLLSDAGLRAGVVNVPMTYPPEQVNGVMVTDMMTPNANVEYTYPRELKRELLENVGPFVITPGEGEMPSRPLHYLDKVRADVIQSARYALYLLNKEPYDFFMYVFGVVDVL